MGRLGLSAMRGLLCTPTKGWAGGLGKLRSAIYLNLSRLELGPSWVLVLRNALEITVEERPLALEMCRNGQEDRPQKQLIFTSKWTTVWHHGMVQALLNTHLPSFDSPIAMEEERPSLQTRT